MEVLIVEANPELGALWAKHLRRGDVNVMHVTSQLDAVDYMSVNTPDVLILNLILEGGSAFAVADYASYRHPDARVIFVTNTSFFSDGSIFQHIPNACAFVRSSTPPEDLAAMVEHYGGPH